jgi:hypothetical protein
MFPELCTMSRLHGTSPADLSVHVCPLPSPLVGQQRCFLQSQAIKDTHAFLGRRWSTTLRIDLVIITVSLTGLVTWSSL